MQALLILNAVIPKALLTDTDPASTPDTLWVADGQIQALGTYEEVLATIEARGLSAPDTLDAKGATLLPGFNDSHMHLLGYGQSLFSCSLTGTTSADDLVTRTRQFIESHGIQEGTWVSGRGWNQDYFDMPELPTREVLDRISTKHPILLSRACGHVFAVNSKALEMAGLAETLTVTITDGAIDVDAQGRPTGILRENAVSVVTDLIPNSTLEQLKGYILAAQEALFKEGITSVQSDDLCVYPRDMNTTVFNAFKDLAADGRLKIKVYEQSLFQTTENLQYHLNKGYTFNEDLGTFRTGPLKILGDGSLGGRTAFLSAPYADDPSTTGIALYTQDQLNDIVITAAKAGLPSVIHAIGDGMLDMALNALEAAQPYSENQRHGIVHCQVTRPEQLERMKALRVHALVQPIFLDYDLHMAENRLGQARAATTYAFKTMIDLGIPAAYGTDCPVEGPSVWNCIQCAVTRSDLKGLPTGGWLPNEAVSLHEALIAYTSLGAWASGEEDLKGRLENGMAADLILVSQNPYETAPHALSTISTLATLCNGELVWLAASHQK